MRSLVVFRLNRRTGISRRFSCRAIRARLIVISTARKVPMAFKRFSLLLLCCFSMAVAGCAGKQKTGVRQPDHMSDVAVVVTPKQGGGPATAALNRSGINGDQCLLAMVKPADGPINSPYGNRRLGKKTKFHKGIDIGAKRGSDVVAAASGKVVFSGTKKGYGKTVDIEHRDGIITRYAHLDAIFVSGGQTVKQSERLGLVGRSGRTTGPNLHFELLAHGRPVNPLSEGWIDVPANNSLPHVAAVSGPANTAVRTADAGTADVRAASAKTAGAKAGSTHNVKVASAKTTKGKASSAKSVKTSSAGGVKVASAKSVKNQHQRRL